MTDLTIRISINGGVYSKKTSNLPPVKIRLQFLPMTSANSSTETMGDKSSWKKVKSRGVAANIASSDVAI